MPNNQNLNLIFPAETYSLISDLLEKYQLKESTEEIFTKLEQEKNLYGEIIIGLVKKIASEEISFENFMAAIKMELNVSQKKAEEIAKDLRKNILVLIEESPGISQGQIEQKPAQTSEDIYREILE